MTFRDGSILTIIKEDNIGSIREYKVLVIDLTGCPVQPISYPRTHIEDWINLRPVAIVYE